MLSPAVVHVLLSGLGWLVLSDFQPRIVHTFLLQLSLSFASSKDFFVLFAHLLYIHLSHYTSLNPCTIAVVVRRLAKILTWPFLDDVLVCNV